MPINHTALERCLALQPWLESWVGKEVIFLEPEQWFLEAYNIRFNPSMRPPRKMSYRHGAYVSTPPPTIGDVALEQL